jgi:hypothetical protein
MEPAADRLPLVRIVRDWAGGDLLSQMPDGNDTWEGVQFTEEEVDTCDYLLVLNRSTKAIRLHVPRDHVWMLVQEPSVPQKDFVFEGHERYGRVFTHHVLDESPRYTRSQPAGGWWVERTYDELIAAPPPAKTEQMSLVASNLTVFAGHRRRLEYVQRLRQEPGLADHCFGRETRFIQDKWDALAPYRYSIAIENSSSPDYWTEKIADCFMTWTVPLYYGAPNIAEYFPERSLIWLPMDQPDEAMKIVRRYLQEDDWESRFDALKEARELVLNRYQLFPWMSGFVREHWERQGRFAARELVNLPVREAAIRYRLRRRYRQAARLLRLLPPED